MNVNISDLLIFPNESKNKPFDSGPGEYFNIYERYKLQFVTQNNFLFHSDLFHDQNIHRCEKARTLSISQIADECATTSQITSRNTVRCQHRWPANVVWLVTRTCQVPVVQLKNVLE